MNPATMSEEMNRDDDPSEEAPAVNHRFVCDRCGGSIEDEQQAMVRWDEERDEDGPVGPRPARNLRLVHMEHICVAGPDKSPPGCRSPDVKLTQCVDGYGISRVVELALAHDLPHEEALRFILRLAVPGIDVALPRVRRGQEEGLVDVGERHGVLHAREVRRILEAIPAWDQER